jgi:ATP-dependent DNA helicase RecG
MQSYCLLFTESKNPQAIDRLKAMETMSQGAQLAEFDLKIRGAGELYGLKQSGSGMLKIASFADSALIKHARDDAQEVSTQIEKYPELLKMVNDSNSKAVNPD